MKPIFLFALVGALAAPASAGDVTFGFGFRHARHGKGISVAFGYLGGHRHGHWVPGHYEVVTKRVWVPGAHETVWLPAEWGWRYDYCGIRVRYLVRPAGYVTIYHPGHWEYVEERIWVPGHRVCGY